MQRFRYEYSRIDAAVRQIVRLRRQLIAAGDMALRRAFAYEISEKENAVNLICDHIEREMHRDDVNWQIAYL
jgi:hypothetical protein